MNINYHIINVFVENGRGGNPAGVVLDADRLNHNQKQTIASTAGLSETAFVSRSSIADFKFEFFTPTRQIAHCGHATIAAFSLLRELGRIGEGPTSKETIDGKRDILIADDKVFMEQKAPTYRDIYSDEKDRILAALGLEGKDLSWVANPAIVDTGNAFLIVPVQDYWKLADIKPDLPAIKALSEEYGLIGFYVFTESTQDLSNHAAARMFAPAYGIDEEAATGMAGGPLACLLHDRVGRPLRYFNIEQGYFMPEPSPSLLQLRLETENRKIQRLFVGGNVKVMKTQQMTVTPRFGATFSAPSPN